MSIAIIAVTGIIPSIMAGRPGGGSSWDVVYPCQYLKGGHIINDSSIINFRYIDGEVVDWETGGALSNTIWFLPPSCGARIGNSVQMNINFHSDGNNILIVIIYYWDGFAEGFYFTGAENQFVSALALIPNYKVVDYICFWCPNGEGSTTLDIDYLAACYPNVHLGLTYVNFYPIDGDLPDIPSLPPGNP